MNQPRGAERDSLLLLATMRLGDQAETQRIKVRNLSPGGMMGEGPVRTSCGERLAIDLRNVGWISGTVAWVMENRFGVVFDRQIDCKAVRQPVTGAANVPELYVPRPPAAISEPEPGNLRRI